MGLDIYQGGDGGGGEGRRGGEEASRLVVTAGQVERGDLRLLGEVLVGEPG